MFKPIVFVSTFVYFAGAMELQEMHIIGPHNKSDEVSLCSAQTELTRSYEARELGWVPAMYEASGLKECMSREFFMVNALREIKERMSVVACCPGLQDWCDERECASGDDCESLFMGANVSLSLTTLLVTAALGFNGKMPFKFPANLVDGSCVKAQLLLNYTAGRDWAHWCIDQSTKFNTPCNVTAAQESFNKTGHGLPQPSFCCYGIADQKCYEVGQSYNKNSYPALYSQAQWDAWKPFMIACPAILAVQLGYIGGKKLRRYFRHRSSNPLTVADATLLVQTKEETLQV
jgi:hypothetical protein